MSPPSPGDLARDFALDDPVSGAPVTLKSEPPRDTLLVFVRGTWCPFCRRQLALLAERHDELRAADVRVLAVSCQSVGAVRAYVDANPLPFPLLADASRRVAMLWGVHYWLRWDGFRLAHPSLFVIDQGGVVRFAHIGKNMRDLPLTVLLEKFLGFLGDGKA